MTFWHKCGRFGLFVLVAILLAHAAWVLFSDLLADNPGNLEDSAGLIFDGPSKCHNARTRVLFGVWRTDEWTPYLHSPLHTLLMTGVFKLLGVGFAQMRLLGALVTMFSLILLYLILRPFHRGAAWLVLILGAVNHIFLIYGRAGLLEPLVVFFMLLATWLLGCGYRADLNLRTSRRASFCFVAAALATVAAFLSKAIASYFVLTVIIYLLAQPPVRRRNTWIFLAVLALAAVGYLGVFLPANREFFVRETTHWTGRALSADIWISWARQPFFANMQHAHLILMLAFLALPFYIRRAASAEERARLAPLTVLALTLLAGSQFLAFVQYRPLRYYLPLVPCALALAAAALARAVEWGLNPVPLQRFKPVRFLLGWAMGTYVVMFGVLQPIKAGMPADQRLPHGWRLALSAGFVLAVLLLWRRFGAGIQQRWAGRSPALRRSVVRVLAIGLLATYLVTNMDNNLYWTHRPVHAMADFSRMLGRDYRNAVFAGTSPTFLVMENRHQSRKVTPYGTNWREMRESFVTHLLLSPGNIEKNEIVRRFPHLKPNAPALERVETSGYIHDLYPVNLQSFEAVSFQREATGGWALEVKNPDEHSPQTACLVGLGEAEGHWKCLGVDEQKVLPLSTNRFRLPNTVENLTRARFYLLPRTVWITEMKDPGGRNVRWVHDAVAWNMQAWRLKRSSRAPASEESYIDTVITNGPPVLIGVRVSGMSEPTSEIRLEERAGDRSLYSHPVPVDGLQAVAYLTHIACAGQTADQAPDRIRLVYRGRPELRVNGFLALTQEELERSSLWQMAWPSQKEEPSDHETR